MPLRDYQESAVHGLRASISRGHRKVLLVSPTGSGKTVMFSEMVRLATLKGNRVLVIAHRKELVEQTSKKLDENGIDHGVIKSGHWRARPHLPVQVASIQTLIKRDHFEAELAIIDEAHRAPTAMYGTALDRFQKPPVVVGVTATPYRLDGLGLGDMFEDMIVAAHAKPLCAQGYLMEPEVIGPAGGSIPKDMPKADIVVRGKVIEHWKRYADNGRTAVFCRDVQHSKATAEAFREAGIPAAHLDGKTSKTRREEMLQDLADGRLKVICNCNVLTEGWDLPLLECIVLLRPTESRMLYKQMVGRVMRPHKNKRFARVIDHVGLTLMHGPVTSPERYTLSRSAGDSVNFKGGIDEIPLAIICEACNRMFDPERRKCPYCGAANDTPPPERTIAETNEKLVILPSGLELKQGFNATQEEKQAYYTHLCQMCIMHRYNPGWVAHRYKEMFTVWPRGMTPTQEFRAYKERMNQNAPHQSGVR